MGSAPSKCLPAAVEHFCNELWLVHGLADATIAAYRADLLSFSSWLSTHNGKTLLQALIQDIDEWLASLLDRKISARSVARYTASLRRFYQYLVSNDLVSQDPTASIRKIKIPQKLPNPPTQDEVASLLDITDLNSHQGLRDKALLELLYATGLRAAELSGLKVGDIDFRNRVIRVCGKGSKERLVVYGEEAAFWLDLYAWAMPHAGMIGYVAAGHRTDAKASLIERWTHTKSPAPCAPLYGMVEDHSMNPVIAISIHARTFMLRNGEAPGNIMLRHMWLSESPASVTP